MTHSRSFILADAFLLLPLAAPRLMAQNHSSWAAAPPSGVLSPTPSQWWIGPQIGANLVTHSGDFVTDFCQCSFADGSGAGISVGLELGHMLSPWFGLALKAVYSGMGADYSYFIMRNAVLETGETVLARHERTNRVELGYLSFNPVLQLHPFNGLYFFAGPAVGFNTAGTTEYTLKIADDRYLFDIGGPEERPIEEDNGDIPGLESLRLDLRFGLGANIRLGRSFLFSPEVSYNLPMTTISSDDNWKAEAFHLIGVFKFEL